jgi:hypothetical protein
MMSLRVVHLLTGGVFSYGQYLSHFQIMIIGFLLLLQVLLRRRRLRVSFQYQTNAEPREF